MNQYLELLKRYKRPILLGAAGFLVGAILLLCFRGWLVVHWVPGYTRTKLSADASSKHLVQRRTVPLYYWKDDGLKREVDSFVWRSDKAEDVRVVVGAWLSFLYEERLLPKRVSLESVALSTEGQDLFISFDHLPFAKAWSIRKKGLLVDGLCRTVASLDLGVQSILFLVNHETMVDAHLDFSQPWPIDGFG